MFTSIDRVTAEIQERFQQLQNLLQRYAFLRHEVILSIDKLNLDQAPQDINKEEVQLEHICLQAFVAVTDPGYKKKELIRFSSLGLLKYIIESKLEDGLPNIAVMLRIFLTSAISNASLVWRMLFQDQKRMVLLPEEVGEKGFQESRSPTFRIDSSGKGMQRTGFEGPYWRQKA
ncbi:uncharacterized protein TNCV_1548811 [Trichonephila clavipes]|nr:uncharacterized protein TNCV_1548811 [Trichonephila clavipes]